MQNPSWNGHDGLAASAGSVEYGWFLMFDLHSHLLPYIDDGAPDFAAALDMARCYAGQGVQCVACTPHILPGLYDNTGPDIRRAVAALQTRLDEAGIALRLVTGADNHMVPDFSGQLKRGHLLSLSDTAYVLVEPPHHVAPARIEGVFFEILLSGYVPVLTHPERLSWIENKYDFIVRLARKGVWLQVTSGSLLGRFGRRARYWAERMIEEGIVHILATDAHNMKTRPPDLLEGRKAAERLAGAAEAQHLVVTRPHGALLNKLPHDLPAPHAWQSNKESREDATSAQTFGAHFSGGFGERVRRFHF
jgi:protein-tyrosine phosphatase